MADRSQPDANNIHSLIAVSNADGISPVTLWADPTTHALVTSGGGGGTGGADVQYATGAAQATPTGTVALGWDGSNVQAIKTTAAGVVNIAPITSLGSPNSDGFTAGANVQYTDAFNLMYNGSAWDRVRGDTTNGLFVNVKSSVLPTGAALDATLTGGTQQAKLTDGTNTANVLKSDGTSAGNNAVKVAGSYQEFASLSAGSLNADLLPSTDVSGYKYGSVQITGTYVGTVTFQGSNDGTNFFTINTISNAGSTTNFSTGVTSAPGTQQFSIYFRYLRVRVTAYTSGTVTGTAELFTVPPVSSAGATNAIQSGTWTVGSNSATGSAVPANAFFFGMQDGSGNLAGSRTAGAVGDGATNTLGAQGVYLYNGTTWDRNRGTTALAGLASAARTATTASTDLTNWNHRGVRVTLNVTVASGTGGLQLQIQGKDSGISGAYYAINATPTAVIATGTYVYDLYPSAITVQGGITQVTNSILSRVFRVNVIHGDASSYTYSVSYEAIL